VGRTPFWNSTKRGWGECKKNLRRHAEGPLASSLSTVGVKSMRLSKEPLGALNHTIPRTRTRLGISHFSIARVHAELLTPRAKTG